MHSMSKYLRGMSSYSLYTRSLIAIKLRGLVIPVQAEIHPRLGLGAVREMDPRLRGDDSLSLT